MTKNIQFLLISSALFSYQILISTYLSSSLAGQSISLLIAPTYLAFALAIIISFFFEKLKLNFSESLSFVTLLSLIISLLFINHEINNLTADILTLGKENRTDFRFLVNYLSILYNKHLFYLSLFLCLPFFTYGLYFSNRLKDKTNGSALRQISYELVGACLGVLLSLIILNYYGWILTFLLFFLIACLASLIVYIKNKKYPFIFLMLVLLSASFFLKNEIAPVSNLHISARDFSEHQKVDLLRESWNSFSKVQTLLISPATNSGLASRKVISIGDGTGHANMPTFDNLEHAITADFTNYFKPKKVLILFAGAGHELIKLSEQSDPPLEVTGVEINSHVIKHGLLGSNGALQKILENKKYQLIQSDARQFLEKDISKYDAILFSWSGATVAYYSGAIMHTTQYVFTREALQAALNKLTPTGHLIIFGGSKLNLIAHLKALKIEDLKNKITLLEPLSDPNWKRNWDNHILIISKTNEQAHLNLENFIALARFYHYKPVIHPLLKVDPNYAQIENLILSTDWKSSLHQINESIHLNFMSHTDDSPFVYHIYPNFSQAEVQQHLDRILHLDFNYTAFDMIIYLFIFLFFILIGAFFCNENKNASLLPSGLSFLFGLFSTALQFYAIYKSVLFLGFPNFALGLGLMTSLGSSLICFYLVQKIKFSKKYFFFLQLIGLAFLIILISIFQIPPIKYFIFSLPLFFQVLFLLLLFLITFSLNGFFYPYLLSVNQTDLKLSKQIIAFDVIGCGLGALLIPLLMEDNGISTIMLFGAGLIFLLVWILLMNIKKLEF